MNLKYPEIITENVIKERIKELLNQQEEMLTKGKEIREKYLLDFHKHSIKNNTEAKRELRRQVIQRVLKEKKNH